MQDLTFALRLKLFTFLLLSACTIANIQDPSGSEGYSRDSVSQGSSKDLLGLSFKIRIPAGKILDSSGYLYDPKDTSCGGFPKLEVQTLPGTCLGMVLPKDRAYDGKIKFVKPRVIVQIPHSEEFLVTDMGGWGPRNGRLFWLRRDKQGNYEVKLVNYPLSGPHGLVHHSDGYFYLGERNQISRFHFDKGKITDWELVVTNLDKGEGYMHPLSQIAFNPKSGDLLINSGSPSDHCYTQKEGTSNICPEVESNPYAAKILQVPEHLLRKLPVGGIKVTEVVASGLRNSMAMVISPQGYLVQGENSRDFPELEEPYEEINVLDLNKINSGQPVANNFGWPYCFNFHAVSPEWILPENHNSPLKKKFTSPIDCTLAGTEQIGNYKMPHALMPPHTAPLHMNYYREKLFSDLFGDHLLVTWHGYQPMGQRLVAYPVDEFGLPIIQKVNPRGFYGMNMKGSSCVKKMSFIPKGGLKAVAPYKEIISGWGERKGVRPKGAPVSFTVATDGSIWLVEDRDNNTVVRLARSQSSYADGECSEQTPGQGLDPRIELLAWRRRVKSNPEFIQGYHYIKENLVDKYCQSCHGGFFVNDIRKDAFATMDYLFTGDLIVPGHSEKSKLWQAISRSEAVSPMPPAGLPQFFGTSEGVLLVERVQKWIDSLPSEVTPSIRQQIVEGRRNIRNGPSTKAKVCGVLDNGDTIYIEGTKGLSITEDHFVWIPIYLVPNHSRLIDKACEYPEDGVFYFAVKR